MKKQIKQIEIGALDFFSILKKIRPTLNELAVSHSCKLCKETDSCIMTESVLFSVSEQEMSDILTLVDKSAKVQSDILDVYAKNVQYYTEEKLMTDSESFTIIACARREHNYSTIVLKNK